jgi:hypothetical protein
VCLGRVSMLAEPVLPPHYCLDNRGINAGRVLMGCDPEKASRINDLGVSGWPILRPISGG